MSSLKEYTIYKEVYVKDFLIGTIYVIIILDFFEVISDNSFHINSDAILVVLINLMTTQKTVKIGQMLQKKSNTQIFQIKFLA